MAEENGWIVVGEFVDEGFSAYSGNRGPGLEQAKRAAADAAREYGTTAMLVAQAHDRFARGAGDRPGAAQSLGELWHEMRRLDVHLRTVEDDEELRDEASVAAIGRRAYIDSRRKSKAVKKGHARRKAKGLHHGQAPLGAENDNGLLKPIEAEAATVQRVFIESLAGRPQEAVASDLRRDGIRAKRGGEFRQDTVSAILRNPIYVELGIIDSATFEQAQARRLASGKVNRGRRSAGGHLFRGEHLRCGYCGAPMRPRTRKRGRDYYGCKRHLRNREDCFMRNVSRELVDGHVLAYFEKVWLDVNATRAVMAENLDRHLDEARSLRAQAELQEQKAQERLARVRGYFHEGKLSPDEWRDHRDELAPELEAASAEVERLCERERAAEEQQELKDAEAEVLHELSLIRQAIVGHVRDAQGIDAVRAALQRTFDYFTISPYCPPEPWPDHPRAAMTDDAWVKTGRVSYDAWREWEQLAIIAHGGPFMDDSQLYAEMPGSTWEERFWEWRRRNRVPLVLAVDNDGRTVKRP